MSMPSFWRILIPHPRFSRYLKTDFHNFRCPPFPMFPFWGFHNFDIYKHIFFENELVFSNYLRYPGSPDINITGFWEERTRPEIPKSKKSRLWGSPMRKSKSYKFKMDRNNSTELLGYSFDNIYYFPMILRRDCCTVLSFQKTSNHQATIKNRERASNTGLAIQKDRIQYHSLVVIV